MYIVGDCMKSRMDKYYVDEDVLQRTSRNINLYEDLYKDKPSPESNVTFIDNISEIDVNKIKEMVNSREEYKKVRQYEELVNKIDKKEEDIPFEMGEIDESKYDINQIIEKKRQDKNDDDKVRKLCDIEYTSISYTNCTDDEILEREKGVRELVDTITDVNESTDFFANLKETDDEEVTKTVKETTFYTDTVSFEKEDYDNKEDEESTPNNSSVALKIIIFISFIAAVAVFVWFKFFT